jgi:hypothetical protein
VADYSSREFYGVSVPFYRSFTDLNAAVAG